MKFSSSILLAAAAGLARSTPVEKRSGVSDADILNYALTLEHLEATFYAQGLKNFTHQDFLDAGFPDPMYSNLKRVGEDEKSHVQFLTKALSAAGAKPVEACTYDFPVTDVKSFLALGNVLEGVGVSAYLGAAAHITNDTYLTAAGSILTVEARHSSYLRAAMGEVPFAQPFDDPLDFNEVYTVASPFIASCPSSNAKLPVKAFPSLTMTSKGDVMTGSMVTLECGSGMKKMDMSDIHAAFITVTGPVWADVKSKGDNKFEVTIPKGVMGQSYVVLTKGDKEATDDNIVAGPAIVEIGKKVGTGMGCNGNGNGMSTMSMSNSMTMPPYMSMSRGMMPTSIPMSNGGGMGMSMTSSMAMPTGGMMPSGSSMSSMPSASMSGSGMPPVVNGAGKLSGGLLGAAGAGLAIVMAL